MTHKWVWDDWQEQILKHEGNIAIRTGRQCGKSEVVSEKAVRFALEHAGSTTLVVAATQRQSGLLFEKIRGRLDLRKIKYPEKPTLTRLVLPNGSRIYCLPTGRTGYGIRGYTVDLLIADEAAFIGEEVWTAVEPMLATTAKKGLGWIILISTPQGKGGYFYNAFFDDSFLHIHVSSEDCVRIPKSFLYKKRRSMTKVAYKQEFLAEFLDEWHQFFPTQLLKEQATFIEWSLKDKVPGSSFYLGVDVARFGGDENAFVVCEYLGKKLKVVKCFTTERVSIVDTIHRVIDIHNQFGFKRIFVDDSGIGGGVTDLLQERLGVSRVIGLNNASKRLKMQGEERQRGILKEDLYSNALVLLESRRLEIINDLDLIRSMKSMTYEYGDYRRGQRRVKIFGAYSHLTEALVRAVWCDKVRGLRLFVY